MTPPVLHLSPRQARRIAVTAQLLEKQRPADLSAVIGRLGMLQLDPTAAIAPSADLVAWSRIGSSYQPADLKHALEVERSVFEFSAVVRPMADLGLYLAGAAGRPSYQRARSWLQANDRFRTDILALLLEAGPTASRDIPDTSVIPWPSSGWTSNRNVTQMLEILLARGEVAVSERVGRERVWDLASRVYPAGAVVPTVEEAERRKNERRLAALGIARARARQMPVEPIDVGVVGVPAVVDGVKGEWRVDPAYLDAPFDGRTALLSPFDRLVHDRVRAEELFGFEFTLEMYKPAAKRRWGYYALPILYLDRLVGKLDASVDRTSHVMTVHAIHQDVPFSKRMETAVRREIAELAAWLGVDVG